MIYVVMRRHRQWQTIDAVAAFDNHLAASKYADEIDDHSGTYAYRVDSVHLNPTAKV